MVLATTIAALALPHPPSPHRPPPIDSALRPSFCQYEVCNEYQREASVDSTNALQGFRDHPPKSLEPKLLEGRAAAGVKGACGSRVGSRATGQPTRGWRLGSRWLHSPLVGHDETGTRQRHLDSRAADAREAPCRFPLPLSRPSRHPHEAARRQQTKSFSSASSVILPTALPAGDYFVTLVRFVTMGLHGWLMLGSTPYFAWALLFHFASQWATGRPWDQPRNKAGTPATAGPPDCSDL